MVAASPLSAESNFRELDDAFLQSQTRIWLGEVLQIRFDEEANISDILADGELLFEVSELLSRMLPTPPEEAPHLRVNEFKTLALNKSTRRYMPYYNVGSFLRMCKNLGLNGVDLFSPSDVVDKRNTRKVCMCIRSLSKKVRSRDINVPDFDSVICTLAMPTDMVECIRKSLELSQSSSSLSVGNDSEKISRVRYWKRMSNSDSMVSNGYSSDNCDEAESRPIIAETSNYAFCETSSNINSSQLIIDNTSTEELPVNVADLENVEDEQCEYLSPSIAESVGSPSSVYYSDEELSSIPSSTFHASRISGINSKLHDKHQIDDMNHVPIDWGDISSDDDYVDDSANIDKLGLVSHDIDILCITADSCSVARENKTCNECTVNSYCPEEIGCEKSTYDIFELVTTSNSIVAGRNLDVCNEYAAQDSHFGETSPCHEKEQAYDDATKHGVVTCDLSPDDVEPSFDRIVEDSSIQAAHYVDSHVGNLDSSFGKENYAAQVSIEATNLSDTAFDVKMLTSDLMEDCNNNNFMGENANEHNIQAENVKKCSDWDRQDIPEVLEDNIIQTDNVNCKPVNEEDILFVSSFASSPCYPKPEAGKLENVEVTSKKHHQCAEDREKDVSDGKGINKEKPQRKPRRALLKSVVKGMALVGVAVFLLHLRKNSRAHIPKLEKQPIEVPIKSSPKQSSMNAEETSSSSSVYPAQKLNLGI